MTESLQVPGQCHFAHVIGRNTCNDYKYWSNKADAECAQKVGDKGEPLALRSFAILEPCGLDMFRGVEFVCCPKNKDAKPVDQVEVTKVNNKEDEDEDEDDDDDDETDESTADEDAEEDDDKAKQDPYFKDDDSKSEHERFKEAEERLEKKHRKKVTKVITEWSDLFERYNKMKETDPKGAEEYKREMTARFRKTVAALEEENKEQRKQIEELHDSRVQTALNEKKRQATHEYRSALAMQVGVQNKQNVLRALKTYIKAEEKDRNHMLNRFRHLLRSDPEEAQAFEPILMHRLRYIDLRINGTLAMLRDFPALEKHIRPIAIEFWREYRRENTPEVNDDEVMRLGDDESNEKLIQLYKKTYERTASLSDTILVEPTTTTAPTTTTKATISLKTILNGKATRLDQDDSEESDEDEDDEDEAAEKPVIKKISINVEPIETKHHNAPATKDTGKNEDDDDEEYEDDDEDSEETKKESLHVVVEPIVERPIHIQEELPESSAYAKQERLVNEIVSYNPEIVVNEVSYLQREEEFDSISAVTASSNAVVIIALISALTITTVFIVMLRRRSRHPGFIEVDVCTPEERHVAGMQVNGYENPSYSFFDNKP